MKLEGQWSVQLFTPGGAQGWQRGCRDVEILMEPGSPVCALRLVDAQGVVHITSLPFELLAEKPSGRLK